MDPYRKSQRSGGGGRTGQVSAIDYTAGRGSTGVDLRWHPKPEFKNLADDQRDELTKWMKTSEGKKHLQKNRGTPNGNKNKRKQGGGNGDKKSEGGNWKKKFKKALNTPKGLAHIMYVMAEEEKSNQAFISSLQAPIPVPPAAPAVRIAAPTVASVMSVASLATSLPSTLMKLASILKRS